MNRRRYKKQNFKEVLESANLYLEAQGLEGVWNSSPYSHGFYNGMEYMLSLIEGRSAYNTKTNFNKVNQDKDKEIII